MAFLLPQLPYSYDALEPYIDAHTMEMHYVHHHAGYLEGLLDAVAGTDLEKLSIEQLLARVSHYPAEVRFHAGGYYNHTLFWETMASAGAERPDEEMAIYEAIDHDLGGYDHFRAAFTDAAVRLFGVGWVWLCLHGNGRIFITTTPNQDNPLMDVSLVRGTPLLALDMWEHAYYLGYQNRRAEYVEAFFQVINWRKVTERYAGAGGARVSG